jgi:hypothetical protein
VASISPAALHFGTIEPGETAHRTISIGAEDEHLQITAVEIPDARLSVIRIGSNGKADRSLPLNGPPGMFRITFSSNQYGYQRSAEVVFRTNLPEFPKLTLPVTAEVVDALDVTPPSLFFTGGEQSQTKQLRVTTRLNESALPPTMKLMSESNDSSSMPLHIQAIEAPSASHPQTWLLTIALRREEMETRLYRAVLRIELKDDHVNVPIVVIR